MLVLGGCLFLKSHTYQFLVYTFVFTHSECQHTSISHIMSLQTMIIYIHVYIQVHICNMFFAHRIWACKCVHRKNKTHVLLVKHQSCYGRTIASVSTLHDHTWHGCRGRERQGIFPGAGWGDPLVAGQGCTSWVLPLWNWFQYDLCFHDFAHCVPSQKLFSNHFVELAGLEPETTAANSTIWVECIEPPSQHAAMAAVWAVEGGAGAPARSGEHCGSTAGCSRFQMPFGDAWCKAPCGLNQAACKLSVRVCVDVLHFDFKFSNSMQELFSSSAF